MKRDIKTLEQNYVDMRNQLLEKGFTEEEIAQYFYAKLSGDNFDEKLFPNKILTGIISAIGIANFIALYMYVSQQGGFYSVFVTCGIGSFLLAGKSLKLHHDNRLMRDAHYEMLENLETTVADRQKKYTR